MPRCLKRIDRVPANTVFYSTGSRECCRTPLTSLHISRDSSYPQGDYFVLYRLDGRQSTILDMAQSWIWLRGYCIALATASSHPLGCIVDLRMASEKNMIDFAVRRGSSSMTRHPPVLWAFPAMTHQTFTTTHQKADLSGKKAFG